jgi:hypothetical protein
METVMSNEAKQFQPKLRIWRYADRASAPSSPRLEYTPFSLAVDPTEPTSACGTPYKFNWCLQPN